MELTAEARSDRRQDVFPGQGAKEEVLGRQGRVLEVPGRGGKQGGRQQGVQETQRDVHQRVSASMGELEADKNDLSL